MISRVFLLSILLFSLISCDKEAVLKEEQIPSEISEFVSTHFPENKILQVVMKVAGITKKYEVLLEDQISLEFNRKKEIIEIDAVTELPASVIPSKVGQYVNSNYSNNVITDWELEDKHQQVGLDNGLELEFTMEGEFIRIDS